MDRGWTKSLIDLSEPYSTAVEEMQSSSAEFGETSSGNLVTKKSKLGLFRKCNVALRKFFSSKLWEIYTEYLLLILVQSTYYFLRMSVNYFGFKEHVVLRLYVITNFCILVCDNVLQDVEGSWYKVPMLMWILSKHRIIMLCLRLVVFGYGQLVDTQSAATNMILWFKYSLLAGSLLSFILLHLSCTCMCNRSYTLKLRNRIGQISSFDKIIMFIWTEKNILRGEKIIRCKPVLFHIYDMLTQKGCTCLHVSKNISNKNLLNVTEMSLFLVFTMFFQLWLYIDSTEWWIG